MKRFNTISRSLNYVFRNQQTKNQSLVSLCLCGDAILSTTNIYCNVNNGFSNQQPITTSTHKNYHVTLGKLSEQNNATTPKVNTIENVSDFMKKKLLENLHQDYKPQIEEAFSHFVQKDFSSTLKILSRVNELVYNVEKNFFTEEMQTIRMIYQYINFLE